MKWLAAFIVCFLPGCTNTLPQTYIEAAQKRCEKNGGAKIYTAYNFGRDGVNGSTGWVTCNDGAIFNDVDTSHAPLGK